LGLLFGTKRHAGTGGKRNQIPSLVEYLALSQADFSARTKGFANKPQHSRYFRSVNLNEN
jgi:hypothetical protein